MARLRRDRGHGRGLAVIRAIAGVLAALIARCDELAAIPVSLGLWAITGLSVVEAGFQLGHTGLTHRPHQYPLTSADG